MSGRELVVSDCNYLSFISRRTLNLGGILMHFYMAFIVRDKRGCRRTLMKLFRLGKIQFGILNI